MLDSYRHKGMRHRLVEEIHAKGIRTPAVLLALEEIPRHFFLEKAFEELAYQDRALPIGAEQTISQPFTVAYQTELLEIQANHKVLEIGTGSGYQASILASMGAKVYTIERHEKFLEKAKKIFDLLGLQEHIYSFWGDGFEGLPQYAPFDRIVVTAAAPYIPENLLSQLSPNGGRMVIPVNSTNTENQIMQLVIKQGEEISTYSLDNFRFVPMLKGRVK